MDSVRLRLLVLKTGQPDQLKDFYQSLGMDLFQERHGDGPLHYAGRVGDTTLEVYPLPEGIHTADATTRLGFTVNNLEQVLQVLQAAGTIVASPPQPSAWGCRAVVRDPDGRAVELYEGS